MIRLTKSSLANIAGAVVVIYLAVILGQTIANNYHLQKQIDALKAQVAQQEQTRARHPIRSFRELTSLSDL